MCQWFSRRFIFRIKRADVKLLLGFSVPKPRIFLCVGAGLGQPIWFWDNAEKKSRREMECLGIISRVYGLYFCDELITRAEESCRLWCVVVCDLETSRMRRSWPALGRSATKKKGFILADRFQKSEIRKHVLESCNFFLSCYTAPKLGNSRRRKMRCSRLVSGRWNGEYCMFCGATGWRILK